MTMHNQQQHLAWHETLDMHELVAFQSIGLIKCKKAVKEVKDPALKTLYTQAIQSLENNLKELLNFYPQAPNPEYRQAKEDPDTAFYAGNLLGLAKTTVRYYAIAITETATPQLRQVLVKQLNAAIQLHANVFNFMYERSYYPSYNLQQLLANDVNLAKKALSL
jgi:spore coat protein F